MRRVVLLLCFAQAACFVPVRETYRINGSASELLSTARQNAQKLGYETTDGADGGFTITGFAGRRAGESLEVSAAEDTLTIDGTGASRATTEQLTFRLSESAEILARSTDAQLHHLDGPKVAPRSRALTVGLDLLLPAAGAFYALRGSPYRDSAATASGRGFWWEVVVRAELDAVAFGIGAELLYLDSAAHRPFTPYALLGSIAVAVLVRVMSVIVDWSEVGYRNAYAASGLPAPSEERAPVVGYSMRR